MIKKNYIRFNSDGFKEKYNLKRIIATSENVDILYCFADFDTDLEETAYRVFARIERADNKVIGPQLLPLSSVALTEAEVEFLEVQDYAVFNDEAVDDKVYNVACRKLEIKDNATSIVGDLSISIVYQEVDGDGKVINVAVNESVVIPVYKAVKQLAEEDEWNTIKEEMLPRDLGDIITSLTANIDADKVLGRKGGNTVLFTLANLRKYIEEHNVINLGNLMGSEALLNAINDVGVYRFQMDGVYGNTGLLIVKRAYDPDEATLQIVITGDRVKYRSANNVAFTDFVFKDNKEKLDTLHNFIHNVSTGLSAKVDSQGNRIGSLETWKDNTATPKLNDALSKSLGGIVSANVKFTDGVTIEELKTENISGYRGVDIVFDNLSRYSSAVSNALSDALNDGTIIDAKWVNDRIDAFRTELAGGALDEALDTLKELADAINNDPNFASSMTTELGKKVPKTTTINSKALSGNITLDKTDIGLNNVDNVKQATKTEFDARVGVVNSELLERVKYSDLSPQFSVGLKEIDFASTGAIDIGQFIGEVGNCIDIKAYNYPLIVGVNSTYDTGKSFTINEFKDSEDNVITDFEGYIVYHLFDGKDLNFYAEIYLHRSGIIANAENKRTNYYGIYRDKEFTGFSKIAYQDQIPTKVSDLDNDSKFITKSVDNLVNYYTKDQIDILTDISYVEKATEYGVRWVVNAASPVAERVTKLAGEYKYGTDTGLVYNVGTNNGLNVINSFDNIPCFKSERIVMGGDHFIKFYQNYIKEERVTDGGVDYDYIWFSLTKHAGYTLPKVFENADGSVKPYILIGIYEAFRDAQNKLRSIPNVQPTNNYSAANFLTAARLNDNLGIDSKYLITDLAETNWFEMRQQIRMATKNVQSYLTGATAMAYAINNTHITIGNQTNSNKIVLENSIANLYVLHQTISGGTGYTSDTVINYRQITQIEVDTPTVGHTTFTFDGDPIASIPEGTVIASRAWRTGLTDSILATDGYFDANDSKHPIKIDGIENPFGNTYTTIAGIKIKGDEYYISYNPKDYNWLANTDNFSKLSYTVPRADGWIKELGVDPNFLEARLPVATGGGAGANAYYSDYIYQNYAVDTYRTALFGGSWYFGSSHGLFCWHLNFGLGAANGSIGSRLSYRP